MTGKSGIWRFPAPGNSPEPRDLHYLHPLVPRPGSSLSCARARARARGRAQQYIPAAQLARPPPFFPSSPPPVQGPERAPAVNSPGTPLGAGGRARSPPPDPAPPHPAQAVACAAAESPAPSNAARSLPLLAGAVLPPSPRNPIPRRPLLKRRHRLSQCLVLDPNFTLRAQSYPKLFLQRQLRLRRKCPPACQPPLPRSFSCANRPKMPSATLGNNYESGH